MASTSTTPMATPNLKWMMLEPFVFRGDDAESFPDEGDAPFRAHGFTSRGDAITVAFHIRPPPEISRLYLQWPGGPDPEKGSSCDLVAAHGNLLLLRLTSSPLPPPKKDEAPVYPQEHFICRAAAASSSIKLERIPAPLVEKPTAVHGSFPAHTVGILCRGEEDFAIAQLGLSRPNPWEDITADLRLLRSSAHPKWELQQRLPIQFKQKLASYDLKYWRTDKVVAFKTFLFWVDYCSGGMLSCEVFKATPIISYIRLPLGKNRNSGYEVRPFQHMHRALCITKEGQEVNFVDIVYEVAGSLRGVGQRHFTVTCYALRTTDSGGSSDWDKVFSFKSDELGPYMPLTYPLVSMDEANIAHFLVCDKASDGIGKISIVTVDLSAKRVVASCTYIDCVEGLKGKDSEMIKQKSRILQPFVPSELPKWLYVSP